ECKGPEYESIASLGSLIECNDIDAIVYMNSLADRFGLDTIELGNIIAMVYYLVKNGRLDFDKLDGIAPDWGDPRAAIELIERIVQRDGIGNLLAEGLKRVAVELNCTDDAAQVNGMSVPMHDMRSFSGMGVAYATSPRGACHMTCDMFVVQMGLDYEDIDVIDVDRLGNYASETSIVQDLRAFTNSVGICNFVHIEPTEMAQLLSAVTGIHYDIEKMMLSGERIFTLKRLMNLKLGYNVENERIPELLKTPLEGLTEGYVPDVNEHLDSWYRYRDWDRQTGLPSQEKMIVLDLSLLTPVIMSTFGHNEIEVHANLES
ncbi:MAG: aldehyde ferredoxin oxidoreductase C-terminal domain-containing protein, partial [Candidatus Thorarchaeota archaeon]